jgi:O-acetyl-ADP-ribose deacetylase (regulator of RNase III)
MGAGIAKGFKERYPEMFEEYRRRCKAEPREFNLGDCFLWQENDPWVFNLGTQERYWRARASYEAIEDALEKMLGQAEEKGIRTIAIPRIGVGYGGLSWKKVRVIIERVFEDWLGTRVVQFWLSKAHSPRLGGVLGVKIFPRSERSLHGPPSRTRAGAFCVRTEQPWVRDAVRL